MGTIAIAILASAVSLTPNSHGVVANDRVDLIEVNHVYDERGRLSFSQIIFYDWSPRVGRFQVRAWRMLKTQSQIPHRDWTTNDFVAVWHDEGILREVHADNFRESWTQHDPELIEREHLPKERRRELEHLVKLKTNR
ncbi:MAG: hypothetical protein RIC55_29665 [Pirellulaceae bacterium]